MNELICLFCKGRFPIDEFEDKDNPVCIECQREIDQNPVYGNE